MQTKLCASLGACAGMTMVYLLELGALKSRYVMMPARLRGTRHRYHDATVR